jgi:uncharacterized protein YndB with AHSA1/START domain
MARPTFPLAEFAHTGAMLQGRFDIMLENHIEEVWAALTHPSEFVQWLAPGVIEPRPGGRVVIDFEDSGIVIDSTVTAYKPMRVLEYSWSGPGEPLRPIRWELEPVGAAVRLALTVTVPDDEDVGRACAGWAAHLEMLIASLAGVSTKFPVALFRAAREQYETQVAAI